MIDRLFNRQSIILWVSKKVNVYNDIVRKDRKERREKKKTVVKLRSHEL